MAAPALQDATLRHGVLVERYKSGQVKEFTAFLREMDRDLRERLTRGGISGFQRERLEAMLAEIDRMLARTLESYGWKLKADLKDFAEYEAAFTARMLEGAGFVPNVPSPQQVWAAATTNPLSAGKGKMLESFIEDWKDSEVKAVTGALRLGVAQGQTVAEMVKTIRGTKALNYADGLLAVTSRHAEAVVRTSVAHVGAAARQSVYDDNADIFGGLQWDATLDGRTCVRCMSLDQRVFKIGKGPVEPLHVNCRCVRVPLLSDEFAFLQEGEMRASLDGPVDGGMSYYEWLKKQDAEFIRAALGPSRAKLFLDGGLSAERFAQLQLDRRFMQLTLEEMKRLEPLAFRRAGL